METTIVLIGMLLPIAAASIFYAGDKRVKRAQQSDATSATTPKIAAPSDESSAGDGSPVGTAPAETALGNTIESTATGQLATDHTTAGQNVAGPRTAA